MINTANKILKSVLIILAICIFAPTGYANEEFDALQSAILDAVATDYTMAGDVEVTANFNTLSKDSFTINGAGYGINGNSKTGLTITEGQTLTIKNVGSVDGDGNIIKSWAKQSRVALNSGTLNIENSYITESKLNSNGSAIYNKAGGVATISDSTFADNNFSNGVGLIYQETGAVIETISNSKFLNNSTNQLGASICNSGEIGEIKDSEFINNRANNSGGGGGGAITNYGSIGTISNTNFNNNYAGNGGGGLHNRDNGFISSISDCVFTSNRGGSGAAIWNYNSTINMISNSDFISNTANDRAGAVYIWGGTVNIKDSRFINNYSGNIGGAIAVNGTLTVRNSTFTGNYAVNDGGAIYDWTNVSYIDTDFTDNIAGGNGGAICVVNNNTTIIADTKDVTFSGNKSGATVTRDAETGVITAEGGTANDIHNVFGINLRAKTDKSINFSGTITDDATPKGTTNIGGTYTEIVHNDETGEDETVTKTYDGTVNFNDTVTQKTININSGTVNANDAVSASNAISVKGGTTNFSSTVTTPTFNVSGGTVNAEDTITATTVNLSGGTTNADDTLTATNMTLTGGGTLNIDVDNLNITNTINNNSGTMNLEGGTLKQNISNSNSNSIVWNGRVNLLGDLVLENNIARNSLDIRGNTLKYGTSAVSIDVASKHFYSDTGAVLDTLNDTVTHTINMGTVHLSDDLKFLTDVNLNVSNQSQRSDRLNVGSVGADSTGNIVLDTINILTEGTKVFSKVYYTNGTAKNIAHLADDVTITKADGVNNTYTINDSGSDNSGAYYRMKNEDIHNFVTATRFDDLTGTDDVYTLTDDVNIATDLVELGDPPDGNTSSIGDIKSDRDVYTIDGAGYDIDVASKAGMTIAANQTLNVKNAGTLDNDGNIIKSWRGHNASDALFNNNGTISIKDSVFYNNNSSNTVYGGGVLYNKEGANASIEGSTFDSNRARYYGAVIYNSGTISLIKDSVFSNNIITSNVNGSVIRGGTVDLIENTIFKNNTTNALQSNIGSIINSQFIDNTASSGAAIIGGAVSLIRDTVFSGNTTSGRGGAIDHNGSLIGRIVNSQFTNNKAGGEGGGAIYIVHTGGTTIKSIENSIFSGNISTKSGGAIYDNGILNSVSNSTFTNNYAALNGGALYTASTVMQRNDVISNSRFEGNIAGGSGGALYNNYKRIVFIDSDFKDNIASGTGGAIHNNVITRIVADTKDVTFSGNKSGATVTRDSETGEIAVEGGVANDIHNTSTLTINAGTGVNDNNELIDRTITFNGSITGTGTMYINQSGITYTTVDEDLNEVTKNITQTEGTVNFNNTVAQGTINTYNGTANFNDTVTSTNFNVSGGVANANDTLTSTNMTLTGGTLNVDADDLNVTNNINNSAGTINLGGGTLTTGITNTNNTASNWKGTVNVLGDLVINKAVARSNIYLGGNTLKYGTTAASIDVSSKNFYSDSDAVLDTINGTVSPQINWERFISWTT